MSDYKTIKYLEDAIPQGAHPSPHTEWIQVRLDVVQSAIAQLAAAKDAEQHLTEALGLVDDIRSRQQTDVTYETMQRAGFNRKTSWRRKYTLADARKDAETAATRLRRAWEYLDPPITPSESAFLTALGPCGK